MATYSTVLKKGWRNVIAQRDRLWGKILINISKWSTIIFSLKKNEDQCHLWPRRFCLTTKLSSFQWCVKKMLFLKHLKMLSQISIFFLNLCKYQQVQSDSGIDWVRWRLFIFFYSMLLKVKNCGYHMLFQRTFCRLYCLNLGVIWCLLRLLSSFEEHLLAMARSTSKNSPCSFSLWRYSRQPANSSFSILG